MAETRGRRIRRSRARQLRLAPIGRVFSRRRLGRSPSRWCSWSSERSWSSRSSTSPPAAQLVPGKLQFAGEERLRLRPQLDRPRHHRQPRLQKVRAYLATLFFFMLVNNLFATIPFIQFPTSRAPAWPTPRRAELGDLQRRRHPQARLRRLPQAADASRGVSGPILPAARAAGVLLQHPGPAGHAGPASLRQHVRRPHPAGAVRDRWPLPPRRAGGSAYVAGRHPRLGARPSRSASWSSWCSSCRPTSSPCSTPCTSPVRSPTSTDDRIPEPYHPQHEETTERKKPWKAP